MQLSTARDLLCHTRCGERSMAAPALSMHGSAWGHHAMVGEVSQPRSRHSADSLADESFAMAGLNLVGDVQPAIACIILDQKLS